jgi:hypothetical protein
MFNPDKALKEIIFDILKNDGKSISALSRELEERGISIHRLILTGYLRALTDYNYLKEKEVPPAKVYVPVKGREKDVYEVVGDCSRKLSTGVDADLLVLFTLVNLFHRPIFFEELKRAGVRDAPPAKQATNNERLESRRVLMRTGMKVPDSSIAYVHDDPALEQKHEELLGMMVCELLGCSNLIRETTQTRLALDQGARP